MSGIDAAIIAIAFGPLYIEGTINKQFNKTVKIAIKENLYLKFYHFGKNRIV